MFLALTFLNLLYVLVLLAGTADLLILNFLNEIKNEKIAIFALLSFLIFYLGYCVGSENFYQAAYSFFVIAAVITCFKITIAANPLILLSILYAGWSLAFFIKMLKENKI